MNTRMLTIGIGEIGVVGTGAALRTLSLGSCVAVVVLDRVRGISGLAHIVLPESDAEARARKPPGYFADLGVPALLAELARHGSGPRMGPLHVVLVGGGRPGTSATNVFNIGERNVVATIAALRAHGLSPAHTDVGGAWSRTVVVDHGVVTISCPDRSSVAL